MTATDYAKALREARLEVEAAQKQLEEAERRRGSLVAEARRARYPTEAIRAEFGWSRENVRRVAEAHGWTHQWGRQGSGVTPEEARAAVVAAVTEHLQSHTRVRLRDLAAVSAKVDRSESWLSRTLKSLAEEGYLAPTTGGYMAGPKIKATRRRRRTAES